MNNTPRVIDKTMKPSAVNGLGIALMLVIIVTILFLYSLIHGNSPTFGDLNIILLIVAILLGTVVHELLHGVGYFIGGAGMGNVKFGFHWKALMPYAHCKVPLKANGYRFGVALPGIVTGIIPTVIGLATGDAFLTIFGAMMTSGASGDMLILWMLLSVTGSQLVQDHPSAPGFQIILPD